MRIRRERRGEKERKMSSIVMMKIEMTFCPLQSGSWIQVRNDDKLGMTTS